jgi:HSP20 family protein
MSRRDVDKLQAEIEQLFADLWHVPRFSGPRHGFGFRPNVDCFHTDDPHALTVVVELPGVDPESVRVVAGERLLVVAGERPRPQAPGRVYQQMEIEYGSFQRQVQLAEDVEPNDATARFEHGILTVQLPVADRAPLGHVTIEVSRA